MSETATDAQIGAALVVLAVKGETVEELTGMAEAMRAHSVRVRCQHERFIDTAGTGSSEAKTFNVSTAAAFVIYFRLIQTLGSVGATAQAYLRVPIGVAFGVPIGESGSCMATRAFRPSA